MRKTICTASLFVLAIGIFIGSWWVWVPNYFYRWFPAYTPASLPLPAWICFCVIWPASIVHTIAWILMLLWERCSHLCDRLAMLTSKGR